jgi:hypothetical protein
MIKKPVLVIDFRLIKHLKEELPFALLKRKFILKGPPQTIMTLDEDRYKNLRQEVRE